MLVLLIIWDRISTLSSKGEWFAMEMSRAMLVELLYPGEILVDSE